MALPCLAYLPTYLPLPAELDERGLTIRYDVAETGGSPLARADDIGGCSRRDRRDS